MVVTSPTHPAGSALPASRKSYARLPHIFEVPNLIKIQLDSFRWFQEEGLQQLLDEISPIQDFTGNRLQIDFIGYEFREPRHSEYECRQRELTYSSPLYVKARLLIKGTGEIKEQDLFFGDIPLITSKGTFITGGAERVVVSQLIRSPGVYFDVEEDRATGRRLCMAKLIPDRGAWMEFESRKTGYLTLKFNRKRTVPVTIILRALAALKEGAGSEVLEAGTDEELLELFADVDTAPDIQWIPTTIRQEPNWEPRNSRTIAQEALLEFYRRMRPGDPPTLENAEEFLVSQLFDERRYDLQRVGRYKLNQRLGLDLPMTQRTVTKDDVVSLVQHMVRINNGIEDADDVDHLGNRRVKTVGELIQTQPARGGDQPGPDAFGLFYALDPENQTFPCFQKHVVGLVSGQAHAHGDGVDQALVAMDQDFPGPLIATLAQKDESWVVQIRERGTGRPSWGGSVLP